MIRMQSPIPDVDQADDGQQNVPDLIVPPFSVTCREQSSKRWEASFQHPFVQSLVDGSLSEERFRFYQMQDARYLEAYADVCSIISTRISDPDIKLWFIEGARMALVVEKELHSEYGKQLGYSPSDVAALELSPSNRAYQNHMLAAATNGSLLESLAALAPCPWLYTDIGVRILAEMGTIPVNHPFGDWLATYADPVFITYTNELLAHMERIAEGVGSEVKTKAMHGFDLSVRYEWMFWDQAWNLQSWPV